MKLGTLYQKLFGYIWHVIVILLPITSLPMIVKLVGSDVVGLPSGILLLVMVVGWYVPWLLKSGKLPRSGLPLIAFVLAAVFSSALAVFRWIPVGSGAVILREEITSVATLALGVLMFFVSAHWTKKAGRIQITMRLINYTGALVMAWSAVQTVCWYSFHGYPDVIDNFHGLISTGTLYKSRVTGLSLEPSWYAHQLNMLYLPFWFAATMNRYSAHRSRILRRITWENVLLAGGIVTLLLTRSRVGYVAFLLMSLVFFLRLNQLAARWIYQKFVDRMPTIQRDQTTALRKHQRIRKRLRVGIYVVMALLYVGLFALAGFFLYRFDDRMGLLLTFHFDQPQWLYQYLGRLDLGPRVTFWMAGWGVFEQYPLFGSGLGTSGFHFWDTIPDLGWTFEEVRRLMWNSGAVLNPKNLWVRLLAETGIVGFACFVSWLLNNASIAGWLRRQSSPFLRTMGTMGLMVVLGLIVEGFSVDSFALVYFWLAFGLMTSAYMQAVDAKEKEND